MVPLRNKFRSANKRIELYNMRLIAHRALTSGEAVQQKYLVIDAKVYTSSFVNITIKEFILQYNDGAVSLPIWGTRLSAVFIAADGTLSSQSGNRLSTRCPY